MEKALSFFEQEYDETVVFVCATCKGTALILAVDSDGRLYFEECPDCNPVPVNYSS